MPVPGTVACLVNSAHASHRSSLRYVLGTLTGNPQLRRVQAAFVAHNCGEYASGARMLVYAARS